MDPFTASLIIAVAPSLVNGIINSVGGIIQQKSQQNFQRDMAQSQQNFAMISQDEQNEFARSMHQFQQDFSRELQSNDHSFKWDLQKDQQQFGLEIECLRQAAGLLKTGLEWLKSYHLQKDAQGFQWKLAEENFNRSVKLANLNHENSIKLEEFKQVWEALKQTNEHGFQMRLFEERKKLELALKQYERSTQILVHFARVEAEIGKIEYERVLNSNPLKELPSVIKKNYEKYSNPYQSYNLPPQIIIAPPAIVDEIAPDYKGKYPRLSNLEHKITDNLREFLNEFAPENSTSRAVSFIGGESWKSKIFRGGNAAKNLNYLFGHIPTLILDSIVVNDEISLYLSWWDTDCPLTTSKLIDIQVPKYLLDHADDPINSVERLDQEQGFLSVYNFVHQVISGLIIDIYYLSNYNLIPELPKYLPKLLGTIDNNEIKKKIVDVVINSYQTVFKDLLSSSIPTWIPDLLLDLALSLSSLEDKSFAKRLIDKSLLEWLILRDVAPTYRKEEFNTFLSVVDLDVDLDLKYFKNVRTCLLRITESIASSTDNKQDDYLKSNLNLLKGKLDDWYDGKITGKQKNDNLGRTLYNVI